MNRKNWSYVVAALWGVVAFLNVVWASDAYTAAGRVWLGLMALLATSFSVSARNRARGLKK